LAAVFILFAAHSKAGSVSYQNVGTVAPTNTFTADASGNITGWFYGYSAGDTDEIRMVDVTSGYTSQWAFVNKTTTVGASFNFGSVTAGDALVWELYNVNTNDILASNPLDSADGLNHVYAASYSGTGGPAGIPAGTYLGFEDLASFQNSDFDYNDDTFVVENDSDNPVVTPEPDSFYLLGTGILGLIEIGRRKLRA